jgi:transposase
MPHKDVRMVKKKRRKRYAREFKIEAVKQVLKGDRSLTEIAESLGINRSVLANWKKKFLEEGAVAFPGNGRQAPLEEENGRLRRELRNAKQDLAILKKAAVYFAKHSN